MNISSLLSIVVASLAVLGAAGSAWAFLADRGNKDTLERLRQAIEDRDKEIAFLKSKDERNDKERVEREKLNREQHDTIVRLRTEVDSLTSYVNGSAGPVKLLSDLVQVLTGLVKTHHETAVHGIATLETQNTDILNLLGTRRNVPVENVTREVEGNA